jgi:hypothetical protein
MQYISILLLPVLYFVCVAVWFRLQISHARGPGFESWSRQAVLRLLTKRVGQLNNCEANCRSGDTLASRSWHSGVNSLAGS